VLKSTVGGDQIEVVCRETADIPSVMKVVARVCVGEPETNDADRRVSAFVIDRVAALTEVARTLQDEAVDVEDIGLRRPTLDDVFLRLTGHRTDDGADAGSQKETVA
jgi:ABC-2 type transport system ATP-binding protein